MRRPLRIRDAHSCSPKSPSRLPRTYRRIRFEALEPRLALAAPSLAAISDITMTAGVPMYVALNGTDTDGDTLSFSATSSNGALTGSVPAGNRSMKISVTGYGDMTFELFENLAPRTTARIIALANSGFYNGLTFHRIIQDFMIQGGDKAGTGSGSSGYGTFDDEFNADLRHSCAGVLSMAKSSDDTNDSQFFITDAATGWLDMQHSVFGFLTAGDSVRQAITAVAVNSSNKPLTSVVMNSVSIYTDPDSGVLILKAASGFTGTATITATVSDGHGGTAQQTFHVTVNAPSSSTYNAPPYIAALQPIHVKAGQSYTFNIPGIDAEGNAIYYSSTITTATSGLQTSTVQTTGQTTLTATTPGVYSLRLRAAWSTSNLTSDDSQYANYNDTQMVPVYVDPATPVVSLLAGSDSGASNSDRITNLNNTSGKTLQFQVSGVTSGALVRLYADGTLLGQATASGTSAVIQTNGTTSLSEGGHTFTATQEFDNREVNVGNYKDTVNLVSSASSGLAVTVDTTSPQFTSSPLLTAGQGAAYAYNAQTNEEAAGNVRYSLVQSVAGMSINPLTGQITWTPTAAQVGTQDITIRATDLAGQTTDQAFQVAVSAAATIETITDQSIAEGQTLALDVSASDTHLPVSYALENAPTGVTINASTGALSWTPSEAQGPGSYTLTVAVTNSAGAIARQSFAVNVSEVPSAPVFTPVAEQSVTVGQHVQLTVPAQDPDLPTPLALVYSLDAGAPDGMAIDAQTGKLTWTVPQSLRGQSLSVVVRATEVVPAGQTALSSTETVQFQVSSLVPIEQLLDHTWSNLARHSEDLASLVRPTVIPLDLPAPPVVRNLSAPAVAVENLQTGGIFGPQRMAQGGGGMPAQAPRHRIDSLSEPGENDSARSIESRSGEISILEGKAPSRSEAIDRVLELLAQEAFQADLVDVA